MSFPNRRLTKLPLQIGAALILSIASLVAFTCYSASAHEYQKEGIKIDHPWARVTYSPTAPAAVFFDIINTGGEDDRLLSAETDRAQSTELHRTNRAADGRVTMTVHHEGIAAPAGETTSVEHGSYHVMLIGLGAPLKAGDVFGMSLTFEKAGEIDVEVKVEDRSSDAPVHDDHGDQSDQGRHGDHGHH